jgi:hypothetical protein
MTYWNQVQSEVVKILDKKNWAELMDNLTLTVKKLNPY